MSESGNDSQSHAAPGPRASSVDAGPGQGSAAGLVLLGRATLPIYVLHLPLLGALMHLPLHVGDGVGPGSWAAATIYPLAATAVTVLACLGLHRLALRAGLTWAFALPAPLARQLDTAISPPTVVGRIGVDPRER